MSWLSYIIGLFLVSGPVSIFITAWMSAKANANKPTTEEEVRNVGKVAIVIMLAIVAIGCGLRLMIHV